LRINELTKLLSDKRRLLRDEEAKFHEIERKIREKQLHEQTMAERLKNEYDDLRSRFEQMAFELRFSIEDELRIYARLLDELMKKSSVTTTQSSANLTSATSFTTTSSTIRSGGIEEHNIPSSFQHIRTSSTAGGGSSGIFDIAGTQSGWPQTTNLSSSTETLFKTNENEIHETYDGTSIIRSPSFH
jgi:hypothetical protein